MGRIVVGVDSSKTSLKALRWALAEAQLLEAFEPGWLVTIVIGLADSMEASAEALRKRLTKLGLAGARNPVQEDVHPLFLSFKRAAQEAEREITPSPKMFEILPSH
jgi:nucleotide-binding universal stress UspA family protein